MKSLQQSGCRSEDYLEAGPILAARQLQLPAGRKLRRVLWVAGIAGDRDRWAHSLGNSLSSGAALGTLGLAPRDSECQRRRTFPRKSHTEVGDHGGRRIRLHPLLRDPSLTAATFIGSSQVSAQVGYNRILTSHTQIALVYGYQGFDFSVVGTAFHSQIIQGMYGHRISGRMDLLLGAGPQFTFIDTQSAVCSDSAIPPPFCISYRGHS